MMRQRGIAVAVVLGLAACVSTTTAWAEDKPNPTGTWMYSFEAPNGQVIKSTMKLKLEGDKITGTVTGRDNQEAKIENGKFKDDEVSFDVTRERDGNKFTIKYKGKLKGDEIKGKMTVNFGGEDRSFDWEPKRVKEEKK
jgi:hypothetical protein